MTPVELAQRDALARCRFTPATTEKRFVRQLAGCDPATPLTEKQSAFLDRLAHRYRKQIGSCMAKQCECTPKPPRVHRPGWNPRTKQWMPRSTRCGHPPHPQVDRHVVADNVFALVPDSLRCQRCDAAPASTGLHWCRLHVEEWRIGFELLFLSFARLATDMLELRRDPTWRHRCWFDASRRVCACGNISATDLANADATISDLVYALRGGRMAAFEKMGRELAARVPNRRVLADRSAYVYEGPNGAQRGRDVSPGSRLKQPLIDMARVTRRGEP